ncbi:Msm operon regulatory protein [Vibrio phage VP4B]|uniref:Msm operon regulatory protein n=1 Tax=Vibrio phage VP4B TaxID=1262540 RepID=V9M021_9CAUD|nr:transcriptional regulator [Vibrio phage VP4B]AGB07181.1 Msm operon regulatory protein [Vibrio phage VP4B]
MTDHELALQIQDYVKEIYMKPRPSNLVYTKFNMSGPVMGRFLERLNHPSIKVMLVEARMERAKELLAQDMVNVPGIHTHVGYSTRNSFERRFKDHVGMSPAVYRKKIQEQQTEQEHMTYSKRVNEVTQNELRKYLIKHFREPELTLNRVQDVFNLSKDEIQEIIGIVYNCTFEERLLTMRLEEVGNLLVKTTRTPRQLSTECGFVSYHYFVGQFTKRFTVGPKHYRQLKLIKAI